jgi:hypothetical protein
MRWPSSTIVAGVTLLSAAMVMWLGDAGLEWSLRCPAWSTCTHAAAFRRTTGCHRTLPAACRGARHRTGAGGEFAYQDRARRFATGGAHSALRLLPGIVGMVVAFALVAWVL